MADWYDDSDRVLLPTYDRLPIHFKQGEGVYLYDEDGTQYLDALAGIAVNILGYAHPALVETGREAVSTIQHVSNLFQIEPQYRLAKLLRKQGFPGRPFFCNSGAEANEAAIKYARKYQYRRDSSARTILSFEGSFHGRTLGALSATGQTKYQKGFDPLPDGFECLPFNEIDSVRDRFGNDICAVIVEPIQGEGGVRPANPEFLESLRELCDQYSALLIFDEIQTGMGRTGEFYAFQNYGVEPDLITLAKGIANGYPMGAMMAHENLEDGLLAGDHASTFGGNPFVCTMAHAVIEQFRKLDLLPHVRRISEYLIESLQVLSDQYEGVESPRGKGLMIGVPLARSRDAGNVMNQAREEGLIVGTAGENVIRLVPPLVFERTHVNELIKKLTKVLN